MPTARQDKYDLLATVIDAIYDMNKKVIIETVNNGRYDDEPQIPSNKNNRWGPHSLNWARAQSIKIGNIYMKRIPVEKSRELEKKKNWQGIDYSCTYIVRTPKGEAEFTNNDADFKFVWYAALGRYDIENDRDDRFYEKMFKIMKTLYNSVKNPKLKEAAGSGTTPKNDKKSKYEAAIEQLRQLGIPPQQLAKYIQNKQND